MIKQGYRVAGHSLQETSQAMQECSRPYINLILRRHGNHASVSGYDRISDFIQCRVFKRVERLNLWQRALCRILRPWDRSSGSQWYGRAEMITELRVAKQWLKAPGQVYHFVYGENSYRYLWLMKRLRRNYIVCTYHTPPGRFAEVVKDRDHIKAVDAVILVSRVSWDLFSQLLGPERVHFIPHGVDTDYFTPPLQRRICGSGSLHCLFVGSHLRDFRLLAQVAERFAKYDPSLQFEVVTLKRDFHYFEALGNVTLRDRIDDDSLRQAYRSADLFVLPLVDATANNSLLESLACGLPMVVSDLPGVRDYVDDTCARLVPCGDTEALFRAIVQLRDDPQERVRLATNARQRALQFSLPNVARATEKVYELLPAIGRDSKARF